MLTAQKAREIVTHSKIYEKIENAASKGELEVTLDYMTKDIFKSLIDNGYTVFLNAGEYEPNKYDELLFNQFKKFIISWER